MDGQQKTSIYCEDLVSPATNTTIILVKCVFSFLLQLSILPQK